MQLGSVPIGEAPAVKLKLPHLYPKQHAAFFGAERTSICEASTKAGKSVGALAWALAEGARFPGASGLWLSPIYAQAEVMFERLSRMLTKADPQRATWDNNKSKLWVAVPGGCKVWFKGGDNSDSIYGSDYSFVVIDEASRVPEAAWYAVRSTLTATQGRIRIIGNVKGRQNWAYREARKAEAGAPGMAYHKIIAADAVAAGVLAPEEIEDARRTLPDNVFRELYLAEPSDDSGNPFGLAAIRSCVALESEASPVAFGIDLAKSVDWTVVCGLDADGCVCTLDRWQSDWGQTKRRILDTCGEVPTLVDSTGVGDPIVEDLQRARGGVFEAYKFTSQSKQQIMEGLAAAIQRQEVRFPSGWLQNELEVFEYEYTARGVKYQAPEGLHDDGVCALALAVHQRAAYANNLELRIVDADRRWREPVDAQWITL